MICVMLGIYLHIRQNLVLSLTLHVVCMHDIGMLGKCIFVFLRPVYNYKVQTLDTYLLLKLFSFTYVHQPVCMNGLYCVYKALGIKYSVFEAIENIFKIPKKNFLLINLWTHQSLSVQAQILIRLWLESACAPIPLSSLSFV